MAGAVAQSVEQRTENPCVGGSIPPHTTLKIVTPCKLIIYKAFSFRGKNGGKLKQFLGLEFGPMIILGSAT